MKLDTSMDVLRKIVENFQDIATFSVTFPLRYASSLAGSGTFHTRIRGAGPVTIRNGTSDVAVLRQVFRDREYDLARYPAVNAIVSAKYHRILEAGNVPLIIDGGANMGATPIWFATEFPKARIIAVEPDPRNAAICRENTRRHPGVEVLEAALGSASGVVALSNTTELEWAVRTVRGDASATIPMCTISQIVSSQPPRTQLFIAKIDIEGFEEDLFEANTEWLEEVEIVFVEVHDWLFPRRFTSRPLQRAMARYDFEMLLLGENLVYIK
jgi:FkbM family methyltransferase